MALPAASRQVQVAGCNSWRPSGHAVQQQCVIASRCSRLKFTSNSVSSSSNSRCQHVSLPTMALPRVCSTRQAAARQTACTAAASAAAAMAPAAVTAHDQIDLASWIAGQVLSSSTDAGDYDSSNRSSAAPAALPGDGINKGSSKPNSNGSTSSSTANRIKTAASQVTALQNTAVVACGTQSSTQQPNLRQQQQQANSYPVVDPVSGQTFVDPATIPYRPWVDGLDLISALPLSGVHAAAAAGNGGSNAAAVDNLMAAAKLQWQLEPLIKHVARMPASSAVVSNGPDSSNGTTSSSRRVSPDWSAAFVQDVLQAVQARLPRSKKRKTANAFSTGINSSTSTLGSNGNGTSKLKQPKRQRQGQPQSLVLNNKTATSNGSSAAATVQTEGASIEQGTASEIGSLFSSAFSAVLSPAVASSSDFQKSGTSINSSTGKRQQQAATIYSTVAASTVNSSAGTAANTAGAAVQHFANNNSYRDWLMLQQQQQQPPVQLAHALRQLNSAPTSNTGSSSSSDSKIKQRKNQQRRQQRLAMSSDSTAGSSSTPTIAEPPSALGELYTAGATVQQHQHQHKHQQQKSQPVDTVTNCMVLELISLVSSNPPTVTGQTGYHLQTQHALRAQQEPSDSWGYTIVTHPYLLRAQWVAEQIYTVRQLVIQFSGATDSSTSGSSGALTAGGWSAADTSNSSLNSTSKQQLLQQAQQHLADLCLQLQKLLLSHLRSEARSWQDVDRACEMFEHHLNPVTVCGALSALQQLHRRGLVFDGISDRRGFERLVMDLLHLVWQWRDHLGLWESLAVAWALVYLQVKDPAVRDPLRGHIVQQYQQNLSHLYDKWQRMNQLQTYWHKIEQTLEHQGQQQQLQVFQQKRQEKRRQLQQLQESLSQLSLYDHAAFLLSFARLGLHAQQFDKHTSKRICKVVLQQVQQLPQQRLQQTQPQQDCEQQQQQHDQVTAASHLALLLYAMSELGLVPQGSLLRSCCSFTEPLLQHMPAHDLAMLAIALGRFAYKPYSSWGQTFAEVTGAAAADTIAAGPGSCALQQISNTGINTAEHSIEQQYQTLQVQQCQQQQPLNAADITSILTAAHSMNLDPPEVWVNTLLVAAMQQIDTFSLQQCIYLLLVLHKVYVQPQAEWMLAIAHQVTALSGSGNNSNRAQVTALAASSSGAGNMKAVASNWFARVGGQRSIGSLLRPLLPPQQKHQQQQQQQQQHQQHEQEQQQHRKTFPTRRLCVYIWALGKAVKRLPPEAAAELQQQLRPSVIVAAKFAANMMHKLTAREILQLIVGLNELQCRPGPSFVAAHMARAEAVHSRLNGPLYRQLVKAYVGLGFQPTQSLKAMMFSHEAHSSIGV